MKLPWNFEDLTGRKIHHLTFLSYLGKSRWICRCDCGKEKEVNAHSVKVGFTRSCGCRYVGSRTHGHYLKRKQSPEYASWQAMRSRCVNPKCRAYKNYGGRGITCCESWVRFESFLQDMGPKPKGYELERIDVNGNYEPSNCRWATIIEQANNRRNNRRIHLNGIYDTMANHARRLGIGYRVLQFRVYRNSKLLEAK